LSLSLPRHETGRSGALGKFRNSCVGLRLICLFILILITTSFATASSSLAWRNPHVDFKMLAPEWTVSHPTPSSVFLSHKSAKQFVLVTEYGSTLSTADAADYFQKQFARDAAANRSMELSLDRSDIMDLRASSGEFLGTVYGKTDFHVSGSDGGAGFFTERIWAEEGHVWQAVVISFANVAPDSLQTKILDDVMTAIGPKQSVSWLSFVIPDARASELGSSKAAAPPQEPSPAPPSSFFEAPSNKQCLAKPINPKRRGNPPHGLKFLDGSIQSCFAGGEEAVNKWVSTVKESFLNGVISVSRHAEENLRRHPCGELPAMGRGVLAIFAYQGELDAFNSCVTNAGTTAVIQSGRDLAVGTYQGAARLVNWYRAQKNPRAVITAILQQKLDGFLCLNADSQAQIVCEFATHAAGVVLGTALTAGAAAGLGAAAGTTLAARGVLAMNAGLNAAKLLMLAPLKILASPVAIVKLSLRAPSLARDIYSVTRSAASASAAAARLAQKSGMEFNDVVALVAQHEGSLSDLKKTLVAERQLGGSSRRAMEGQIEAASQRVREIENAYARELSKTTEDHGGIVRIITAAENKGLSRKNIAAVMHRAEAMCLK
jgi:hypothetical protein